MNLPSVDDLNRTPLPDKIEETSDSDSDDEDDLCRFVDRVLRSSSRLGGEVNVQRGRW